MILRTHPLNGWNNFLDRWEGRQNKAWWGPMAHPTMVLQKKVDSCPVGELPVFFWCWFLSHIDWLVGGWTNPFENYICQNDFIISPIFRVNRKHIWVTTTDSPVVVYWELPLLPVEKQTDSCFGAGPQAAGPSLLRCCRPSRDLSRNFWTIFLTFCKDSKG